MMDHADARLKGHIVHPVLRLGLDLVVELCAVDGNGRIIAAVLKGHGFDREGHVILVHRFKHQGFHFSDP